MSLPKVSILVPIFNVEKYLDECLDSVLNQTLSDIEVICINDGSTDGSLKIIKKYAKKDNRVVIIDKKNSGYGDSMNRGLKKASGEYVGIVESDDWVERDTFEKMYALASKNDAEVVKANFYNYFTTPEKKYINGSVAKIVDQRDVGRVVDTTVDRHIMWQQPAIWSAIYKNSFLRDNNILFLPSPGASYQDAGFNFKVWVNAKKVIFTEEAFLHYRQDNENSSINNPGKVFCITDEYNEIKSYLKKNNKYEDFKDTMFSTKWGGYTWNIERLAPELAKDFIYSASKEYLADFESGDFVFANFDVNWTRNLNEIMHNPEMAIKRKFAAHQARVSIIVPVYNVESYVSRCLDSLVRQSQDDIEIIVVDDGSTDKSSDITEIYFKSDPRIRIVNQHNQGLSAARNTGIFAAHADYVMFCDSDDYYEVDTVKIMLKAIIDNDVDIVSGSARVVYEQNNFTAQQKHEDNQYFSTKLRGVHDISDTVLRKTDVSAWDKIYKRSIIDNSQIRFPAGIYYEDTYFFYTYAWSSSKIYFLPQDVIVYNYIRRDGSIMSETFNKTSRAYDHTEIVIRLFKFMKERNIFQQHSKVFNDLFKEYFTLSIKYLPDSSMGFLYDRVKEFDRDFGEYMESVDPELRTTVHRCLDSMSMNDQPDMPQTSLSSKAINGLRRTIKAPLKIILYPYRSNVRLLKAVCDLHHKIDRLEQQQAKSYKSLQDILQEIKKR